MSWQATAWAANLPHSRVGHVPFRVLMLLADHAHDDGTATWRAVSSLAATLDVSERTIQRALAELKDQGLIEAGDQRLLNHLPSHRRPVVYNLVMGYRTAQPTTLDAVDNQLSTGVTDLSGVTAGVVSSMEEPPLDITKALNATTQGLSPQASVERCRAHRNGRHQYLAPSGRCLCGLRDDGQFSDPYTGKVY